MFQPPDYWAKLPTNRRLKPPPSMLPDIGDRGVKRALGTALGWLRAAASQPGSVIVGTGGH
jgi:hypothetical protein